MFFIIYMVFGLIFGLATMFLVSIAVKNIETGTNDNGMTPEFQDEVDNCLTYMNPSVLYGLIIILCTLFWLPIIIYSFFLKA